MNLKEAIFRLIKPRYIVELRSLDQFPGRIIAPTMVPAPENRRCACFFSGDGIGAMATDVVECADLTVFSTDQKDGEARDIEGLICPWLGKLCSVGEI